MVNVWLKTIEINETGIVFFFFPILKAELTKLPSIDEFFIFYFWVGRRESGD